MQQQYFPAVMRQLANQKPAPHDTSLVQELIVRFAETDLLLTGKYHPRLAVYHQPRYNGYRFLHDDHKATLDDLEVRVGTTVLDIRENQTAANLDSVVFVYASQATTASNDPEFKREHEVMRGKDLLHVLLHSNGVISTVYYNTPEMIAFSFYPAAKIGFGRFPYALSQDEILPSFQPALRVKKLEQYLREPTFQAMPKLVMFFTDVYRSQLG